MGTHRDAIEKVVSQLHMPPCPNTNPACSSMSLHDIIDTFWNEFKAFQNCTHPHHEPSRWATYNATKGNSYLWHEKYSIPYRSVLEFVACRVTSKLCRIVPAKRSWGGVKVVKDGKRSHLSGKSTEKRTILFVFSKYYRHKSFVTAWKSWMRWDTMQFLEIMISILICNSRPFVLTWGR